MEENIVRIPTARQAREISQRQENAQLANAWPDVLKTIKKAILDAAQHGKTIAFVRPPDGFDLKANIVCNAVKPMLEGMGYTVRNDNDRVIIVSWDNVPEVRKPIHTELFSFL